MDTCVQYSQYVQGIAGRVAAATTSTGPRRCAIPHPSRPPPWAFLFADLNPEPRTFALTTHITLFNIRDVSHEPKTHNIHAHSNLRKQQPSPDPRISAHSSGPPITTSRVAEDGPVTQHHKSPCAEIRLARTAVAGRQRRARDQTTQCAPREIKPLRSKHTFRYKCLLQQRLRQHSPDPGGGFIPLSVICESPLAGRHRRASHQTTLAGRRRRAGPK